MPEKQSQVKQIRRAEEGKEKLQATQEDAELSPLAPDLTHSLFSQLLGQERVKQFLLTACKTGCVSHAYLFLGKKGSGKLDAARALAQALVCPKGGCGVCDECGRVRRGSHPDVQVLDPDSTTGYLIEQIRDLIAETQRSPIRAQRKVYIIKEAELLGTMGANALLKTLEEPPADVHFILLASSRYAMLPTVLSRCQVLPFKTVPFALLAEYLVQQTGMPLADARRALALSGGSLTQAKSYLLSSERQNLRLELIDILQRLEYADDLDIIRAVKKLMLEVKAPLDDVLSSQKALLEENADFLSKGALKELEARNKRELSLREREALIELIAMLRLLLSDVLSFEFADTPVNDDVTETVQALYEQGFDVIQACEACEKALERLRYNITPQLSFELMFFDLREVIRAHSRTRTF